MRFSIFKFIFLLQLLLITGCASLTEEKDETKDWTAKKLYEKAKDALNDRTYESAIDLYEKLEARYPFGRYAQQAQLDVAYAYYKFDEPDATIAATERFIRLHPRHPNIDYAYYLKGLANFNRGITSLMRYTPMDASQRDPGSTKDSFKDFAILLRKFPKSKYFDDAKQRMVYLRNTLAYHEMNVANYYMGRKAYLAALNRAKFVVEKYDKTPAVPEALQLMKLAYDKLKMPILAKDTQRVFALNFPNGVPKKDLKNTIWEYMELDK